VNDGDVNVDEDVNMDEDGDEEVETQPEIQSSSKGKKRAKTSAINPLAKNPRNGLRGMTLSY